MICEPKTLTPSPLESSAEKLVDNLSPEASSSPVVKIWNSQDEERPQFDSKEYHRQYYQSHKEIWREYNRSEYRRNIASYRKRRGTKHYKAKQSALNKAYRDKNRDRIRRLNKRWAESHVEERRAYRMEYADRRRELYRINRDRILERKRELSKSDRYLERTRRYSQKRRATDICFALKDRMRAVLNRAFRRNWIRKPYRTEAMIGCSIGELKKYIENQFSESMSWDRRSTFVVDHHVPVAAFDLTDTEEALLAFNWKNLRPLTPLQNAQKSDAIPDPLPSWLPSHIASRIESRR